MVGIAASGASGSGRPMPSLLARQREDALPVAHRPPWVKITFAALAVSITEPPPTARKLSAPASFAASAHRIDDRGVGVLRHLVEDAGDLEPAVLEAGLDPLDQARAADHLVGDHQRSPGALLGELEAGAPDQPPPATTRVGAANW